jgi:hypothetical protein
LSSSEAIATSPVMAGFRLGMRGRPTEQGDLI